MAIHPHNNKIDDENMKKITKKKTLINIPKNEKKIKKKKKIKKNLKWGRF